MNRLAPLASAAAIALALGGCGNSAVQTAALVTCQNEAAAVSVLADFKKAGKLSPAVIAAVDKDIAIVDPVCGRSTPQAAIAGAAQSAAAELVSLAGSIK